MSIRFPRRHTADMDDVDSVGTRRTQQPVSRDIRRGIRCCAENGIHCQGSHSKPLRWQQAEAEDLVPCGRAAACHLRCFLKTTQNAPGHGAKRAGARFRFRFRNAPERVEIVTGQKCAFGRQIMHKLTVAVVDNVENIKIRSPGPEDARVFEKAIEYLIGFTCAAIAGQDRNSSKSDLHRRSNQSSLMSLSMLRPTSESSAISATRSMLYQRSSA